MAAMTEPAGPAGPLPEDVEDEVLAVLDGDDDAQDLFGALVHLFEGTFIVVDRMVGYWFGVWWNSVGASKQVGWKEEGGWTQAQELEGVME